MTGKSSFGREGDQPVVLMAAYSNYLRDPGVFDARRGALASAGYRVVMLCEPATRAAEATGYRRC